MDSGAWSVIIAALIAVGGAVYATRVTRNATNDVEQKQEGLAARQAALDRDKVDGAAYDRARLIDERAVQRLESDLLRTQTLRDRDVQEYERRIAELESAAVMMRADIRNLTSALRAAGVPIPSLRTE